MARARFRTTGHGLCSRGLRRARLSRERYGGWRESVLRRDDWQCQLCGSLDEIVVHHRPRGLITLCRACHVRVHHVMRPTYGFACRCELLLTLWREMHRRIPIQRYLLPLPGELPAGVQRPLFPQMS